jgi:hypothetical protein
MVGQRWARAVAVAMAGASVLANVAYAAAYPLWSVAVIVLDVVSVYALIVHGDEVQDADPAADSGESQTRQGHPPFRFRTR